MKSYITFLAASLFILTSCVAQNQSMNYDDVYYSAKDKKADEHSLVVQPKKVDPAVFTKAETPAGNTEEGTERLTDEELASAMPESEDSEYGSPEGDTYISNSYYGDDYYDYAYSARLRRFHNNYSYNNYYSDYYTNSYWYDYNPWNWGVSIYMGYNWWYPSYYSYWYRPYSSWGYNGWYDPYSYYGWGGYGNGYYNGYWSGYYDGYWDGYHHGYWPGSHYYNSYDGNSYYYGHRGSVGSSGGISGNQRGGTFQERYEGQMALERNNQSRNSSLASVRNNRSGEALNSGGGTRNSSGTGSGTLRNSVRNNSGSNVQPPRGLRSEDVTNTGTSMEGRRNTLQQGNTSQNNQGTQVRSSESGNSQRPPRYTYQGTRTTPGSTPNTSVRNQGKVQPYSSPSYTKPRSSQEYTAPKYRNTTAPGGSQNSNRSSSGSNNQAPARQENKSYSNPSNNSQPSNSNSRGTYSTPNRTNENRGTPPRNTYSAPTRSSDNSTPSRSNSSYSQPSRSSDYSSPSRSSSSGSSSPSRSSSGSSSSPSKSSGSSSGSGSGHRR